MFHTKQIAILLSYLGLIVIGVEFLTTALGWFVGCLIMIAAYHRTLEFKVSVLALIVSAFAPVLFDVLLNAAGLNFFYLNKIQYLVTPIIIYSIFNMRVGDKKTRVVFHNGQW